MACATLKRSPDWEGVAQLPAKRRRWSPLSSASAAAARVDPPPQPASPFADPTLRITPEQMASEICNEIKRLQHRRQLRMSGQNTARVDSDGSSSGSEGDSPKPAHSRVLFTFKQVRMICERMLREQEAVLRAEYEEALSGKLAEQYESFVRFNLDQVQRRAYAPQDVPYLS